MQGLPLTARCEQWSRGAAAFLGFSIPISVALDNTLLVLIGVLWLASGNVKDRVAAIAANPVALAALALFGVLAAGLLYGLRDPGDGTRYLGKYADLLFVPVFVTLFRDARARELAIRWFCAAMVLSFLVAEVRLLGLLEGNPVLPRGLGFTGGAFKLSITHGLLSAFAAFVFALLALGEKRAAWRLLFAVLALVALKNAALISISRTVYLVLALLAMYLSFALWGKRGLLAACLLLAAVLAGAYAGSSVFRERVATIVSESPELQQQWPSRESVTDRLTWYRVSLEIVRDHPLLGAGTGTFPRAFAEATGQTPDERRTPNPHNEYLLIAAQTGLAGLALMLGLFIAHFALASRLATPFEAHVARGLVIAIGVGCLFNSFLLDHTEGLLYAWLTGVLFGGLGSRHAGTPVAAA